MLNESCGARIILPEINAENVAVPVDVNIIEPITELFRLIDNVTGDRIVPTAADEPEKFAGIIISRAATKNRSVVDGSISPGHVKPMSYVFN